METFTQSLTSLLEGVTSAATWIWSIFSSLIDTIMSNALFALPVLFALASGGVMLTIKVVKKFGMKGKKRG